MANIKQQMKRDITNRKKNLLNSSFDASLKTAMKAVEKAVADGNKDEAVKALSFLNKKLDKSVSKSIHNKNFVARQKSRFAKLVNTLA